MEIWLDTSDVPAIQRASQLGVLHGVTTNPTIAAQSNKPLDELLEALLKVQRGPVAVQVTGATAEEMIKQGETLFAFSNRLLIKVPVTREGLSAIHKLSEKKIPVMATAVFDSRQTLLAARAGATYIAPYYSRICESDLNGIDQFCAMVKLLHSYGYSSKILAASIRSTEQVRECTTMGVDAVTISDKVFEDYIEDHPMTIKTLARFQTDWKSAKACKVLPL